MNTKNFLLSLIAVATAFSFTSCNSDGPNDPSKPDNNRPVFTDIVTVSAINTNSTVFTFRKIDDSPLVTLTVNQAANTANVKVGDRLAISYYSDKNQQYVDAGITVLGISSTAGNGENIPVGKAIDNSNWFTSTISRPVLQRSGEYVNVQFFSDMYPTSVKLRMVLDENTVHDSFPNAYILFNGSYAQSPAPYVYFMSYSLQELWDDSNVQGLNIIYQTKKKKKTFTINRPGNSQEKPVEK